ncbi:hypothetical protein IT570_05220 [Candidatus Sumerlaeota bacterium]|nr:hypothetical protein [Candidatus Sumerlaeota bacterium]
MKKKLLKGCGITVLVLVVLLVGAGIFVTMKLKSASKQMREVREEIVELDRKHPFTAPAPGVGVMEAQRLNDFFAVRTAIVRVMEADPVINKLQGEKSPSMGFSDLTHLIFKLPHTIANEFKLQLEAKNMSPNEYVWFVRTIYTTIYNGKMEDDRELIPLYDAVDETLTQFNLQIAQMRQNQGAPRPVGWDVVVSSEINKDEVAKRANRDLVIQHKDELLEYPQLAFVEMIFSRSATAQPSGEPPAGS